MGILEKMAEIEAEMARTQKNKATEYHVGLLRGKLAKLRAQLLEPPKASAKGDGFDVTKTGDARVVFIGFPSVGKSTLLSKITKTESQVASYEFTTLTAIPGVLQYDGAEIQALDLPGIIQGAASGKGRGRQVVAVAKTADLIMMVLDAKASDSQKEQLEAELHAVGIRLNTRPPDIIYKVKQGGGVSYNATVKQTRGFSEKMCLTILHDWKIHNADILVRDDITVDDFIDVLIGTRKYINCLYVYNKIDAVSLETVEELASRDNSVVISCNLDLNLDYLKECIWTQLDLLRIYTKRKGEIPNFTEALIVRSGSTVEQACDAIHRTLAEQFKYALVWGQSAKHRPQRTGLQHVLAEGDVLSIITK